MKLTEQQKFVLDSPARMKVCIAGRRGGKTFMSIASLAQHARHPGTTCCYISPTHGMARQIMWKPLKNMMMEHRWVKKINESNLEITLVNGSTIMLRSADNPDRLRGLSLTHAVLDEAADISPETWYEVVRPALADQRGSALIISTPKGKGWLWDLFHNHTSDTDWLCHSYTTLQGGLVDADEVESARQDMGEREFRQEFLAEWVDFQNAVYYAFGDHNVSEHDVLSHPQVPVMVGMDFNVVPGTAVIAQWLNDHLHIYDEVELYSTDTSEMAQEIQQRYPRRKYVCFPDSSGAQRRTSAIGGITDHIILRNAGFELRVGKTNPPIKDRVAAVNSALKSAGGRVRLTIDPGCKRVIEGLRKHQYQAGTKTPEKDGATDYSHCMDALGYMIYGLMPLKLENSRSPGRIFRQA